MTEEYPYRPPLKYLLVGLAGLLISFIFGYAIGKDQVGFSILMGLFCLMTLLMGLAFLTIFIKKFKSGNLKLGDDYIEIPGRWKDRIILTFDDILNISEFDTYDNVIEIESTQGMHLIEQNWMKQKDFDMVKNKLNRYRMEYHRISD